MSGASLPPSYESAHPGGHDSLRAVSRAAGAANVDEPSSVAPQPHRADQALIPEPLPSFSVERPPEYVQLQQPETYTFSFLRSNSMVVLPKEESPDARPLYFVSATMNCFMPLSHITTIWRGGNDNAPIVGEFEMGITNAASSRAQLGEHPPVPIPDVLDKAGPPKIWKWQPYISRAQNIHWDCSKYPIECIIRMAPGGIRTMAKFRSHMHVLVPGSSLASSSTLEVFPIGQQYLDEIVLTLLIIERNRLMPGDVRGLLNYQ